MELLFIVAAVAWFLVRYVDKLSGGTAKKPPPATAAKPRQQPTPAAVPPQKRAQTAQKGRFRAAQEQDDAERLHAVHVDSCESKLESLRVLHEAGILDKEEYAERVLRTKARHERAGGL